MNIEVHMTRVCDFCNGAVDRKDRCVVCGSIWPKNKIRDLAFGKGFTDYSYNRYQGLMGKVYKLWTNISANCFLGRTFFWRLIGKLFLPLLGGRPYVIWREPSSIIDVGCGRGAFIRELPNTWYRFGTDIVDYGVSELEIAVGPFEHIEFKQKFDIVRSWHSLEHSYRPNNFFRKLENLVEDKGWLIISTPNSDSLSCLLFGVHWLPYGVETHYWIPGKLALERKLIQNGWDIKYSGTYTLFSAAGSFALMMGLRSSLLISFICLLLTSPLILLEQILGRGDSIVIYARRKNH